MPSCSTSYNKMLKILQANLHRSKTADALLTQIVAEYAIDLVIISEQYKKKESGVWLEDETKTAAIWLPSGAGPPLQETKLGNCYVYARLKDVAVVSCYLTPSDDIGTFQSKLDAIEDMLLDRLQPFIVAGDFNARAVDWGMSSTNSRGRKIMDMAARTGLVVANQGNRATFNRPGCEGTIPDITLGSEHIVDRIKDWKILDEFTGSDHEYILYTYQYNSRQTPPAKTPHRWDVRKLDPEKLLLEIDRQERQFDATLSTVEVVELCLKTIEGAIGCYRSP